MYPEIYEMQVRAIVRAARAVQERTARRRSSRSCTRSWASREELRRLRELTERVAAEEAAGRVPLSAR